MSKSKSARRIWTMPSWMEPYRAFFAADLGNGVEDMMNDHDSSAFNNIVRFTMIAGTKAEISLLTRLHDAGLLVVPASPATRT
jgi:hypothetical protein